MANSFRSEYEQKKWAALQANSNASIKSIVSGKGTASDVAKLSNAVGQLSKLAKSVFDEGVEAVEKSAAASVEQINKKRVSKGKAPLSEKALSSLFELAFAKVLKENAPPLLQDIHDTLKLELYEQDDRFKTELKGQFERFQQFLPKHDAPSVDDMIALFDLSRELDQRDDASIWLKREQELVTKIKSAFGDALREVAQAVRAAKQSASGYHDAGTRYTPNSLALPAPGGSHAGPAWDVVDDEPRHANLPALVHQHRPREHEVEREHEPSKLASVVHALTAPAPQAANGVEGTTTALPNVSLSAKADEAIITAAEQQTKLHQTIVEALDGQQHDFEQERDDEKDEPDNWMRKLRGWLGGKVKKATNSDSWWEVAAKALLLALTDPELFETISKKVRDVLDWDNIKKGLGTLWDWLYGKANTIVDWVLDKLGLGKPKATDNVEDKKDHGGAVVNLSNADRLKDPAVIAASNALTEQNFKKDKNPNAVMPDLRSDKEKSESGSWQSSVNNFLGSTIGYRFDRGAASVGGSPSDAPVSVRNKDGSISHLDPHTGKEIKLGADGTTSAAPSMGSAGDSTQPASGPFSKDASKLVPGAPTPGSSPPSTTVPVTQSMDSGAPAAGKTVSVSTGQNVTFKPAVTQPAFPPELLKSQAAADKRAAAQSPSQQVGLGSIPTTSGVNDSLAISNMGMLF